MNHSRSKSSAPNHTSSHRKRAHRDNSVKFHHEENHNKELHKIKKHVHHMVSEDRTQGHTKSKTSEFDSPRSTTTPTSCGCPYECESELRELRQQVEQLSQTLPDVQPPRLLTDCLERPNELLREAWLAIGPSHLRKLISDELLAICARREQRGSQHASAYAHSLPAAWLVPPFLTFNNKGNHSENAISDGLRDLWRRCLCELTELSAENVKAVLSGSEIPNLPPFANGVLSKEESRSVEDGASKHKPQTPVPLVDSTSNSFEADEPIPSQSKLPRLSHSPKSRSQAHHSTDPRKTVSVGSDVESDHSSLKTQASLEIAELELRARLIRAMRSAKTKSHSHQTT